ncbi:Cystathionine gamma-synthase [Marasmius crinis-equi]|uniref:Cystathionine gamma-synthase n=1 Tax=Marasmius crinis-equi TaxID=585013 RepID=A0ABR3F992_9AGAR
MAMVFPTARILAECVSFLTRRKSGDSEGVQTLNILPVHFNITNQGSSPRPDSLHLVTYPKELANDAFFFWLNAGMGISGRHAEYILRRLDLGDVLEITRNPHDSLLTVSPGALGEKLVVRRRIAQLLNGGDGEKLNPSVLHDYTCGRLSVEAEDVFLYPSGMSAIWHAHYLTTCLYPGLKVACFGFLYLDSLEVYKNWGEGIIPYFDDHDTNLRELSRNVPKISALFAELPSNPTLSSPDLAEIRKIADQHGFLVIVDETVGNFVNTDILQYADVVCTSLSKLFSGSANVLGGSLVINPNSRHYESIRDHFVGTFMDDFYSEDAVVMEFNSRDFVSRVHTINANAMAVANFLRSRSLSFQTQPSCATPAVVKDVLYPQWVTRENYDICRRPSADSNNFGYLLSITFVSVDASRAFYDALQCVKAPTIGTNFTLAIPYAVLAHHRELEAVKKYGIDETLVRLSVGMEELNVIMGYIQKALEAAEKTLD